ncbi:MAG: efflux RND transporter periplasmic adaptor subunit [Pseudomonadota bacterium]
MKVLSKQFCKKNRMLLGAVAICALSVAGTIAFKTNSANAESPAVAAETPVVEVQTVQKQNIRVWSQYSGRLEAVDYAEIRPEIAGRITDIRFQDGQIVNAGDILLVIDPSSYEAQVERAAANLASAAAKAQFTKTELNRAETLIASQAISQTSLDQRINENRSAQANMNAAEADLKQAKINLDHAFVKAPISGRTVVLKLRLETSCNRHPMPPF